MKRLVIVKEANQIEGKAEKRMKKNEQSFSDMWDTISLTYTQLKL